MPLFGRSRVTRRPDPRRRDGLTFDRALSRLWNSGVVLPVLIALAFLAGASAIVLSGEERLPWVLHQRVDQPVTARVDFSRLNQSKTAQLRDARRRAIPNYYRLNRPLLDQIAGDLRQMLAAARAADDFKKFSESSKGGWAIDAAAFDVLKSMTDDEGAAKYEKWIETLLGRLRTENLVQQPSAAERDPLAQGGEDAILIREDGRQDRVSIQRLTYVTNEQHVARIIRELAEIFPSKLRPAVSAGLLRAIRVEPEKDSFQAVYVFDRERTQTALEAVKNLPPVLDEYKRGDILVAAGATITPEAYDLLEQEHEAYLTARTTLPGLRQSWMGKRIGQVGIVFLVTIGLATYTYRYVRRIVERPARCVGFAVLMLGMLLIARLLIVSHWSEYWAITTTIVAAAILTIAYQQRFALGTSTLLAMLTTLTLNGSLQLFIVLASVASVVVILLGDIRSRFKLIEVGVLTAGVAGATALLVGLTQQQPFEFVAGQAAIAAAAALLACSAVLVLLPVIEKVFRIATSMTLLEWADTSSPLLKQLIQKAPGTWQHSHLLGSMAEAAADEIGANGLLVRVGAFYHDVGKMCKPEYFVENQQARISAHSRLAPRMSLLIILGHVKDGLALAREYRLPPVLHQFIAEHHGTTVVRYFHAIAAQQEQQKTRGRGDDRGVDEGEFRYPGPKPRTRESAILMLCDSVEGTVRSLADPTPGRIESVVHDIVMGRLLDGQLDDCDLTLKELARIEQSLVKSLCSIYHGRIAYPKTPMPGEPVQTRTA